MDPVELSRLTKATHLLQVCASPEKCHRVAMHITQLHDVEVTPGATVRVKWNTTSSPKYFWTNADMYTDLAVHAHMHAMMQQIGVSTYLLFKPLTIPITIKQEGVLML